MVASVDVLLGLQEQTRQVKVSQPVMEYIARIVAKTRDHESIALGISPRGSIALMRRRPRPRLPEGPRLRSARRRPEPDPARLSAPVGPEAGSGSEQPGRRPAAAGSGPHPAGSGRVMKARWPVFFSIATLLLIAGLLSGNRIFYVLLFCQGTLLLCALVLSVWAALDLHLPAEIEQ